MRRDRLRAALLALAPLLFIGYMGRHERYFARWLLPVYPMLCLLAGYGVAATATWLSGRLPRARALLPAALVCLVVAQPLITTVHGGMVLSRASTFSLAKRWLDAHAPPGAKVVIEPVMRPEWAYDGRGRPIWKSWTDEHPVDASQGLIDGYALLLSPRLIDLYAREGYCWVVASESTYGRVFDDASDAPAAVAYYRALSRRGRLSYVASPYKRSAGAPRPGRNVVKFEFDQINTYRSMRYERPGWATLIYRLDGPGCGGGQRVPG